MVFWGGTHKTGSVFSQARRISRSSLITQMESNRPDHGSLIQCDPTIQEPTAHEIMIHPSREGGAESVSVDIHRSDPFGIRTNRYRHEADESSIPILPKPLEAIVIAALQPPPHPNRWQPHHSSHNDTWLFCAGGALRKSYIATGWISAFFDRVVYMRSDQD